MKKTATDMTRNTQSEREQRANFFACPQTKPLVILTQKVGGSSVFDPQRFITSFHETNEQGDLVEVVDKYNPYKDFVLALMLNFFPEFAKEWEGRTETEEIAFLEALSQQVTVMGKEVKALKAGSQAYKQLLSMWENPKMVEDRLESLRLAEVENDESATADYISHLDKDADEGDSDEEVTDVY